MFRLSTRTDKHYAPVQGQEGASAVWLQVQLSTYVLFTLCLWSLVPFRFCVTSVFIILLYCIFSLFSSLCVCIDSTICHCKSKQVNIIKEIGSSGEAHFKIGYILYTFYMFLKIILSRKIQEPFFIENPHWYPGSNRIMLDSNRLKPHCVLSLALSVITKYFNFDKEWAICIVNIFFILWCEARYTGPRLRSIATYWRYRNWCAMRRTNRCLYEKLLIARDIIVMWTYDFKMANLSKHILLLLNYGFINNTHTHTVMQRILIDRYHVDTSLKRSCKKSPHVYLALNANIYCSPFSLDRCSLWTN